MMPKRQLYIHVGTGKTGTTALQTFFVDNRCQLERNSIIYPRCLHDRFNHHYLGWCLLKKYHSKKFIRVDVKSCAEEWGHVLSQLNAEQNLISSELLRGLNVEAVSAIKKYVSEFDVKIVVYLRRYDHWLNSLFNQRVKGKGVRTRPTQETDSDPLKVWPQVFAKKDIIVRPYEKVQFYQGSIFADFLHNTFGLELTDDFVLPQKDINLHLHRIVMEYKRMINHLSLPTDKRRLIHISILEVSKKFFEMNRRDDPFFSPKERLKMIECCAPRYAEIAQEYLGRKDGRLFYEPLPDLNEDWQPYEVLNEEDAWYINRYLAENHPDAHAVIQQGILTARSSDDIEAKSAADLLTPGMLKGIYYRISECLKPIVKKAAQNLNMIRDKEINQADCK